MFKRFCPALLVGLLAVTISAQTAATSGMSGKTYLKAPREITSEAKYLTLGRLCYSGQMEKAEAKAREVLDRGYVGTRYECWVHDKLASGYEKVGNASSAIASYMNVMHSSDPTKGSYTRARDRIIALGGTPPSAAAQEFGRGAAPMASPKPPQPPRPLPAASANPPAPRAPAAPQRRTAPTGKREYVKAPREITSEAKYLTLGRLCYSGQMDKAEAKAREVLDRGYTGTRYECWVHDKLASGYEKIGNASSAIASYRNVMASSDPTKGSYTRARDRIIALGGNP